MAITARAGRSRAASLLRSLSLAVLGVYLLLSLYVWWRAAVLTPYSDELDWIGRWRDLQAGGGWSYYLLTPINFHRIPATFGLIALDVRALGGTNAPLIASGALSLAVMAWALGREAARAATPPFAVAGATIAVMLTLMAGNVFDASQPICVDYTHGAVFAVLALVVGEGRGRPGLGWSDAGALLCAVLAAFGDAAALAVWPALALGALRRRDGRRLAAILIVGGGLAAVYALGQAPAAAESSSAALHHPLNALKLALSILALPWGLAARADAWMLGLLIAGVAAAALATHGGRDAPRSERLACGLILFSFGTAAMAGLGRSGLETALDTPLRYAIFMTPLHVGLLILALPFAREAERRPGAAEAALAALLLGLLAQDVAMGMKVISASDQIRGAIVQFKNGGRTPQMRSMVHPDFAHAQQVYAELQRDGLFQHELHLKPGRPAR